MGQCRCVDRWRIPRRAKHRQHRLAALCDLVQSVFDDRITSTFLSVDVVIGVLALWPPVEFRGPGCSIVRVRAPSGDLQLPSVSGPYGLALLVHELCLPLFEPHGI